MVSVYDRTTYIYTLFKVIANALFLFSTSFFDFMYVFFIYTIKVSFTDLNTGVIYMSIAPRHWSPADLYYVTHDNMLVLTGKGWSRIIMYRPCDYKCGFSSVITLVESSTGFLLWLDTGRFQYILSSVIRLAESDIDFLLWLDTKRFQCGFLLLLYRPDTVQVFFCG